MKFKRLLPLLLLGLLSGLFLSSCSEPGGEEEVDSQETIGEEIVPLTYYGQIQSIIGARCATCHYPGEGAPLEFHTYENVRDMATLALAYMESGEMPPWSPDPSCREYRDQRIMPAEEIDLFRQWIEEGHQEGERPENHVDPGPPVTPEPDIRAGLIGGTYHPRDDVGDEYRCFLLDQEFDAETFVTGTHVETGGVKVIHHANIFLANRFDIDRVEALEASSEGPGYPCFGGPGFNSISLIGAWVPGMQPITVPEDSAIVIPQGSRLVLQTHFNTVFADPEPVSPEVTLYTRDEPPQFRIRGLPFANMNFVIPPGESESVHVETYRNSSDQTWNVLGVAPHLHSLATRVTLDVRHQDQSERTCLIDIPDWDFNWQQEYRFLDDQWVEVAPGDSLRLTCIFDNSPENQPLIDGVRQDPQEVRWGDRTVDEMCMAFLVISEPYQPPSEGELCEEFVDCRTDCSDPYSIGCIFNCGAIELNCGVCLINGAQRCSQRHCPQELRPALPCLLNCAQAAQTGGDMDGCLQEQCPEESGALEECLRPRIEGGMCNQDIQSCNVEF